MEYKLEDNSIIIYTNYYVIELYDIYVSNMLSQISVKRYINFYNKLLDNIGEKEKKIRSGIYVFIMNENNVSIINNDTHETIVMDNDIFTKMINECKTNILSTKKEKVSLLNKAIITKEDFDELDKTYIEKDNRLRHILDKDIDDDLEFKLDIINHCLVLLKDSLISTKIKSPIEFLTFFPNGISKDTTIFTDNENIKEIKNYDDLYRCLENPYGSFYNSLNTKYKYLQIDGRNVLSRDRIGNYVKLSKNNLLNILHDYQKWQEYMKENSMLVLNVRLEYIISTYLCDYNVHELYDIFNPACKTAKLFYRPISKNEQIEHNKKIKEYYEKLIGLKPKFEPYFHDIIEKINNDEETTDTRKEWNRYIFTVVKIDEHYTPTDYLHPDEINLDEEFKNYDHLYLDKNNTTVENEIIDIGKLDSDSEMIDFSKVLPGSVKSFLVV